MSNAERLKKSLAQALVTMDWLQAIACAREILELEPYALRERHLLAQLYLRVSGSRLATVQLQKVLQQSARSQKLWKAVAAQKSLEGCGRGGKRTGEYASIFTQVAFHSPVLSPTFDTFPPEDFELVCREMELVSMIQNERWAPPEAGRSLLLAAWGRAWIEGPDEPFEICEDQMRLAEPGSGGEDFLITATEECELLYLRAESLKRAEEQFPAFAEMVRYGGLLPPDAPYEFATTAPVRDPQAVSSPAQEPTWFLQSELGEDPKEAPQWVDARVADSPAVRPEPEPEPEPETQEMAQESRTETHLLWEMWKEFREKRA